MTQIVSIHQPAYLPWPGYFHKIAVADLFVVLDTVQFEKGSYTNRNRINTKGNPQWLTVPVRVKGDLRSLPIHRIQIDERSNWARKHSESLRQNYSKAPFFDDVFSGLLPFYERGWDSLSELCREMLSYFLRGLQIDTPVVYASDYQFAEKNSDLVLEICQRFDADVYLSGALGRDYIESESFREAGIALAFQDYSCQPYEQIHGPFSPGLSIVDLLFNLGWERAREVILRGNQSREELSSITYVA